MEGLIFLISPVIGFTMMLYLIMIFVRMSAGKKVTKHQLVPFCLTCAAVIFILIYVS
ncbi:hypothetical protein [Thalassobacillus sp. CUG 92003]|uniref:hypothetical protein n=1 Tax=Thalassobacillus sp. CUG 92003 TaxID=2736641 RepID=UPI0015E76A77|nr:hypothetical protein [Thalassobacillus sp. CUG 92003]